MAKKWRRRMSAFESRRSHAHGRALRTLISTDRPLPIRAQAGHSGCALFFPFRGPNIGTHLSGSDGSRVVAGQVGGE